MTTALEVTKHHHAAEVPDMKRVGCRVDTEVSCDLFFLEQFVRARHHLVYHAAPCKFLYEIFHCMCSLLNCYYDGGHSFQNELQRYVKRREKRKAQSEKSTFSAFKMMETIVFHLFPSAFHFFLCTFAFQNDVFLINLKSN